MVNLLHLLNLRTRRVRRAARKAVPIPTGLPATDAVFLLLRRMRTPFIVLIVTFSVATTGMTFMPGRDTAGHTYYLTPFDAFYQMTMTVTTVGFTEAPYSFTYPQRMWMTVSIFMLVVSWAYAIGVIFSIMQDESFQDALATQRFRRRVHAMREHFILVVGFGAAGHAVGAELDKRRRRFVVLEKSGQQVQLVATDEMDADVPALEASGKVPGALGLAGLGHPMCEAVLALTDDDETNLAVVMSTSLLRPDLPVIARCTNKTIQTRIEDFAPSAIINPDDRYGGFLALALHQPITNQLAIWLMDNEQHELAPIRVGLTEGKWLVAGDCPFGDAVTADLRGAGLEVDLINPNHPLPDLDGVAGFVAASTNDLTNIALAEQARMIRDDLYLAVRQRTNANSALLDAMEIDSVYISTEYVAREVLARVLTPIFWQFVELLLQQDEEFARDLRGRLVRHCGRNAPQRDLLVLDAKNAPAAYRWLRTQPLSVGDLLRHPDDRDQHLPLVPLMLIRGEELLLDPGEDTGLQIGDQLLIAGSDRGISDVRDGLFYSSTIEYLATGNQVPQTWVWRALARRKKAA